MDAAFRVLTVLQRRGQDYAEGEGDGKDGEEVNFEGVLLVCVCVLCGCLLRRGLCSNCDGACSAFLSSRLWTGIPGPYLLRWSLHACG